jgi:hypothetical protein
MCQKDKTEHSYRNGLVEQITRDMQTLGQLAKLGYVAHPGEQFYLDRIEAYQFELCKLDNSGPGTDRGEGNNE